MQNRKKDIQDAIKKLEPFKSSLHCQKIIDQLKLLEQDEDRDKEKIDEEKTAEKKADKEKIVKSLREDLVFLIQYEIKQIDKELKEQKEQKEKLPTKYCDQIFNIQIMLAYHFPQKDDEGNVVDGLYYNTISVAMPGVVPLSSGHLFFKQDLIRLYQNSNHIADPKIGYELLPREIDYLRSKGIPIKLSMNNQQRAMRADLSQFAIHSPYRYRLANIGVNIGRYAGMFFMIFLGFTVPLPDVAAVPLLFSFVVTALVFPDSFAALYISSAQILIYDLAAIVSSLIFKGLVGISLMSWGSAMVAAGVLPLVILAGSVGLAFWQEYITPQRGGEGFIQFYYDINVKWNLSILKLCMSIGEAIGTLLDCLTRQRVIPAEPNVIPNADPIAGQQDGRNLVDIHQMLGVQVRPVLLHDGAQLREELLPPNENDHIIAALVQQDEFAPQPQRGLVAGR